MCVPSRDAPSRIRERHTLLGTNRCHTQALRNWNRYRLTRETGTIVISHVGEQRGLVVKHLLM